MSFNVLFLAALADHIASYFSADAARWPIRAGERRAIPVQWVAGEAGDEVRQVVEALRARTVAPYRSRDADGSIPIVAESEHEPALAVVTMWRETRPSEGDGLRYELTFPGQDLVWTGWFALRMR